MQSTVRANISTLKLLILNLLAMVSLMMMCRRKRKFKVRVPKPKIDSKSISITKTAIPAKKPAEKTIAVQQPIMKPPERQKPTEQPKTPVQPRPVERPKTPVQPWQAEQPRTPVQQPEPAEQTPSQTPQAVLVEPEWPEEPPQLQHPQEPQEPALPEEFEGPEEHTEEPTLPEEPEEPEEHTQPEEPTPVTAKVTPTPQPEEPTPVVTPTPPPDSRTSPYPLSSETKQLNFPAGGGTQTITIQNTTQRALAYQVEASEAEFYSSRPTAQFLDVGESKDVIIKRSAGGSDKGLIAIVVQEAAHDEMDAKELFRTKPIHVKRKDNCLPIPVRVQK